VSAYEKSDHLKYTVENVALAMEPYENTLYNFLFEVVFPDEEVSTEIKSVGLRIVANMISCKEDYNCTNIRLAQNSNASPELRKLTKLLLECIEHGGQQFAGLHIDNHEDQLQFIEASAINCVLLCRILAFGELMKTSQWQELAWKLVNSDIDMKRTLLTTLASTIQVYPVPLKFLAFPCLFATVPELADQAQKALVFAIRRLRRSHEEMTAKLVNEKEETRRDQLKYWVQEITPERVLPHLLYLLSYHPEFPTSMAIENEEDRKKVKDILKCVQMLIFSLQSTLRHETSNLPFLFKQLNLIMQKYVDREDPDNLGLHFLTRMTIGVLNDQVKTSDNVQVYPGEISLPPELFMETEEGKTQQVLNRVAGETSGLDSEALIEKLLQGTVMNKGMKKHGLASPGKPSSSKVSKLNKSASSPKLVKKEGKEGFEPSTKKSSKPVKEVKPEEVPTRNLPKRGTRAVTSYAEVEEDDDEVEKWNVDAAKDKSRTSIPLRKSIPDAKKPEISFNSAVFSPFPMSRHSQSQPAEQNQRTSSSSANFAEEERAVTAEKKKKNDSFDDGLFLSPISSAKLSSSHPSRASQSTAKSSSQPTTASNKTSTQSSSVVSSSSSKVKPIIPPATTTLSTGSKRKLSSSKEKSSSSWNDDEAEENHHEEDDELSLGWDGDKTKKTAVNNNRNKKTAESVLVSTSPSAPAVVNLGRKRKLSGGKLNLLNEENDLKENNHHDVDDLIVRHFLLLFCESEVILSCSSCFNVYRTPNRRKQPLPSNQSRKTIRGKPWRKKTRITKKERKTVLPLKNRKRRS
jgi:hypothetical protein